MSTASMESTAVCSVEGCERVMKFRKLCRMHYNSYWRSEGFVYKLFNTPPRAKKECSCGKGHPITTKGVCDTCYRRGHRQGLFGKKSKRKMKELKK